jgi:hypothetical protein
MLTVSLSTTFLFFAREHNILQEYRQICVNINRIKIAMEMGRRVVLCNLDNLYESLYDALNQVHVDRDQIWGSDRGGGGGGDE